MNSHMQINLVTLFNQNYFNTRALNFFIASVSAAASASNVVSDSVYPHRCRLYRSRQRAKSPTKAQIRYLCRPRLRGRARGRPSFFSPYSLWSMHVRYEPDLTASRGRATSFAPRNRSSTAGGP
jgi:hypothetical protein